MGRKTAGMQALDTSFRRAIHESYDHICAYPGCRYCGNHSFRYSDVSIECAHWHNRHSSAGRWYPDNVACLCHERHQYLENRRAEEADFFYDHLGMERYDDMIVRMQGLYRYKPWERAEMSSHYHAQRKHIAKRRMAGETGIILVTPWD